MPTMYKYTHAHTRLHTHAHTRWVMYRVTYLRFNKRWLELITQMTHLIKQLDPGEHIGFILLFMDMRSISQAQSIELQDFNSIIL